MRKKRKEESRRPGIDCHGVTSAAERRKLGFERFYLGPLGYLTGPENRANGGNLGTA